MQEIRYPDTVVKLTTNGRKMAAVCATFFVFTCLGPRDRLTVKTQIIVIGVHLRRKKQKESFKVTTVRRQNEKNK